MILFILGVHVLGFAVAAFEDGQCIFQSRRESVDFFHKSGGIPNLEEYHSNNAGVAYQEVWRTTLYVMPRRAGTVMSSPERQVQQKKRRGGLFSLHRTTGPPPYCSRANPCKFGSCQNSGTQRCICYTGWAGSACDIDMCDLIHPRGADVAIILDGSSSQDQVVFERQKEFIKPLMLAVPLGTDDFRFSVTTAGSDAVVHFNLTTHLTNDSLIQAIDNITPSQSGASNVHKAMSIIRNEVFNVSSNKTKYVVTLGDGLYSGTTELSNEITSLKALSVILMSVGFGNQVLQQSLIDTATDYSVVFPPTTDDLKHWLLSKHVMEDCPECSTNYSDVFILLETSPDLDVSLFYQLKDSIITLVSNIPFGDGRVHLSLATFADTLHERFAFDTYVDDIGDVRRSINEVYRENSGVFVTANLTHAIKHVRENVFVGSNGHRTGYRKVAILFISQVVSNVTEVVEQADALKSDNVTVVVVTIAHGDTMDISAMLQVVSDPAYLFVIGDSIYGDMTSQYALRTLLEYKECVLTL